jgi:adenylate kinase
MQIILLGPPGAGKGTQALLLCKELAIPHISTGEILRQEQASGSELGKLVKSFLDAGKLVPDETIIAVTESRLSRNDCQVGFLLDGFPRTVQQAEALDAYLKASGRAISAVVQLTVPEQTLLERIKNRSGSLAQARSDDNAEVAAYRLQVYWSQTAPVAEYYRQSGMLREVDGVGSVEEVKGRVLATIGK